jgi:murein DD-endopeptidase MepM/ murein hydrolase activator NlpD
MAFNQPIQSGFLRPVFLDKTRQQSYDEQNPNVAPIKEKITEPVSNYSQSEEATKFSNLLSALRTPRQSSAATSGASNSTPATLPTLDSDFTKLGAMTTGWGDSTRYEKFHPAVDIANKPDTPIPTFAQGTVTAVETGKKQGDNGYGNTVIVTDAQGNKHRYSHLHQVYVKIGDQVGKGQEIATMGNSGSTYSPSGKGTGTHLDYRIVDARNKYVNPYNYFKKIT